MADAPVILAIETSQREGGVALQLRSGEVLCRAIAGRGMDGQLMPAVDDLTRVAGIEPGVIDVAGVSAGPGGFTGLRIAISVVKMLSLVHGTTLVAAPSAAVAAESFEGDGPIGVALASKRDTVWWTRLVRSENGAYEIAGTPGIADAGSVDLSGVAAVLGDSHLPEAMRERCAGAGVGVIEPVFDARACARVIGRMHARLETVDAMAIAPIYPRPPEAVSLFESRRSQ